MVPPLTLYTAKPSAWSNRVSFALAEIGVQYTVVNIDLANKPSNYYTEINPAGLVPVLQVGNSVHDSPKFPESGVVLELLADLFPEAQLLPVDPLQRAEVRYFLERFTQLVWSHIPLLLVQSDASVGPKVLEGVLEVQRLLARREGTFLLGEQLSLGDIGVASFVGRLIAFGVAGLLAGGVWETLSTDVAFKPFLAYADVLTSRPAFKATFFEDITVAMWRKRRETFRGL